MTQLEQQVRFGHTYGMSLMDEVFEKAGGRDALMRSLGVSKQTISDWVRKDQVSAPKAAAVEKLTGISRKRLAPNFPWDADKERV